MLATVTGFPVSTTHGLTGAIVGSGLVAVGTQVDLGVLSRQFLLHQRHGLLGGDARLRCQAQPSSFIARPACQILVM
jgi:hypothetical protein